MIDLSNATITMNGNPIETTNKSTPDYIEHVFELHSDVEIKKGMVFTIADCDYEVVEVEQEGGFFVVGCKVFSQVIGKLEIMNDETRDYLINLARSEP